MSKRGKVFIGIILVQIFMGTATFACYLTSDFTVDNPNPSVGEEVVFTDNSEVTGGSPITYWEWNFGDGAVPATANTQGPHQVVYLTEGGKTVKLTINNGGTPVTKEKTDFITVYPLRVVPFSMVGIIAVFLLVGLFIVFRIRKKLALN